VVVVGVSEGVSSGIRMSKWSRGQFVGMKVGVRELPTCDSDVSVRKSAKVYRRRNGVVRKWPLGFRRGGLVTGVWGCSSVRRVWS
jgi:hypothetical protein